MDNKPEQAAWRYAINYGPEGEANYANVYDATGALVSNLRIYHDMAVVDAVNRRAPDQTREALRRIRSSLQTELERGVITDTLWMNDCPSETIFDTLDTALSGAQSQGAPDAYDRGRRDMLNALLSLNPKAAERLHHISFTGEPFTNHDGRLPFDVAFWVGEVAEQLGIEPKDDVISPTPAGKEGE